MADARERLDLRPAHGSTGDRLDGLAFLHQRYTRDDPHYSGRVTVPLLWDKREQKIVNNESADIVRIFNSAFDAIGANALDFYPEPLREEIERLNGRIYPAVNNGVYRAGFATRQDAYEEAFVQLFEELDYLEGLLGERRLAGEYLTEADIRLFTTLVRFDAVYHGHFSATCGASKTTRIFPAGCASCTNVRASARQWTSNISRGTTTPATAPSTRPG